MCERRKILFCDQRPASPCSPYAHTCNGIYVKPTGSIKYIYLWKNKQLFKHWGEKNHSIKYNMCLLHNGFLLQASVPGCLGCGGETCAPFKMTADLPWRHQLPLQALEQGERDWADGESSAQVDKFPPPPAGTGSLCKLQRRQIPSCYDKKFYDTCFTPRV